MTGECPRQIRIHEASPILLTHCWLFPWGTAACGCTWLLSAWCPICQRAGAVYGADPALLLAWVHLSWGYGKTFIWLTVMLEVVCEVNIIRLILYTPRSILPAQSSHIQSICHWLPGPSCLQNSNSGPFAARTYQTLLCGHLLAMEHVRQGSSSGSGLNKLYLIVYLTSYDLWGPCNCLWPWRSQKRWLVPMIITNILQNCPHWECEHFKGMVHARFFGNAKMAQMPRKLNSHIHHQKK